PARPGVRDAADGESRSARPASVRRPLAVADEVPLHLRSDRHVAEDPGLSKLAHALRRITADLDEHLLRVLAAEWPATKRQFVADPQRARHLPHRTQGGVLVPDDGAPCDRLRIL